MKELFTSIKPHNKRLSQHIAYYYFHQTPKSKQPHKVIFYPHYVTALNFYKHAEVSWDATGRVVHSDPTFNTSCLLTCNAKISRTVTMIGENDKIGIIFNPLGINHFIQTSLNKISTDVITPFDHFGDSFQILADKLYQISDLEKKRDLLDAYFLERFTEFADEDFKQLIYALLSDKSKLLVEELAAELGISRKTLFRKFKKHLCCSPRELKSLIRFRKALDTYQNDPLKPSLTHLAYESQYYDQSDFIKQFKGLVGLAPKQLFARIKEIGENGTYWTHV